MNCIKIVEDSTKMCIPEVIISHGPGCFDGATAAWAFWRLLPKEYQTKLAQEGGFYRNYRESTDDMNDGDSFDLCAHPNSCEGALMLQSKGYPIVFAFAQPGEHIPYELIKDRSVAILDLDLSENLVSVVANASKILIVDHHVSTHDTITKFQDSIRPFLSKITILINSGKSESAATLAWQITHGTTIPDFVQIVRIGDTWDWESFPHLKAKQALHSMHLKRTFQSFYKIENTFINWQENAKDYIKKGAIIIEHENALVNMVIKQASLGYMVSNGTVYTVAYVAANILHSDIGFNMKKWAEFKFGCHIHFCATWKYNPNLNRVTVSLRNPDPHINLSEVARNIKDGDGKGGGHHQAAGFSFPGIENLHSFIKKNKPMNINSVSFFSPKPSGYGC